MMPFVVALDPKLYPKLSGLFFSKDKSGKETWGKLSGDYVLVNKNYWATALGVKPGDRIKLSGKDGRSATFEVLGYFDAFLIGSRRSTGAIVMSQENAERYLGITEDYDVLVKLKGDADKATAFTGIRNLVRGTQFKVVSNKQISKQVDKLMAGPQAFLYLLFGITVFVGLIGVVNTIAIGVLERRREIGLIKAVGGTRKHVKSMIMLESILISLVGAILGIALSTGIAILFIRAIYANDFMPSLFVFPVSTTLILLMAVVLVSIIGVLVPIRFANRITPIEALRFE
ncbi:MAG: FtsX-like permease family protein [Actinobacteria bacterium]|nr:FtsX-like permease family protein [Actinomycetota bacterium]